VQWEAAVLYNSLGRYEEALAAAQRASEDSRAVRFASWALVELVEAVRSAVPERGRRPSSGSPASPAPAMPSATELRTLARYAESIGSRLAIITRPRPRPRPGLWPLARMVRVSGS
jgi:hypothetical protein